MHSACTLRATRGQGAAWAALRAGYVTEAGLARLAGREGANQAAAMLLQLDRAGLLQRELRQGRKPWLRVQPQRAPDRAPQAPLPRGRLKLQGQVVLHASEAGMTVEAPGGWALLQLLRPELLRVLDALARGCSAARVEAMLPQAPGVALAFLESLAWCGLLAQPGGTAWATHDLLFHSRTRRGLGRGAVGKVSAPQDPLPLPPGPRVPLAPGCAADLSTSLAGALERRQSLRVHADTALPLADLGRWLWHTLAAQAGAGPTRRPYPSGGRCYALLPCLVVARCEGLEAGLYAYDAQSHELVHMGDPSGAQQTLLQEAAGSAQTPTQPQVLLVLCADYARMRSAYGDLGYSLLLKEVGAVMQTGQLVAAALNLACCPLGTGNAQHWAEAAGVDALTRPSVGELMLGRPA